MHPSLFTLPRGKDRPCCTSQRESPETLVSLSISKTDSSSPISWEATLPLPPDSAKFRVDIDILGSVQFGWCVRTSLSRPVCIVPREGGIPRSRWEKRKRKKEAAGNEREGGAPPFLTRRTMLLQSSWSSVCGGGQKEKERRREKGYHDHSTKRRRRGRKGAIP